MIHPAPYIVMHEYLFQGGIRITRHRDSEWQAYTIVSWEGTGPDIS